MVSSIRFAPIHNDFTERIIDLILPIQQIEFNVPVTIDGQPDLLDIDRFYYRPGGGFWGATDQEKLVGTIALMKVGHGAGVIRKMFVRKEYRGGTYQIAQQLFNILKTESAVQNMTDLYLGTVDMLKAAHRFYERNGFKRIDVSDLPEYFPRMMADNVFYHLYLNDLA